MNGGRKRGVDEENRGTRRFIRTQKRTIRSGLQKSMMYKVNKLIIPFGSFRQQTQLAALSCEQPLAPWQPARWHATPGRPHIFASATNVDVKHQSLAADPRHSKFSSTNAENIASHLYDIMLVRCLDRDSVPRKPSRLIIAWLVQTRLRQLKATCPVQKCNV
jgi:hypothetical protein